MRKQCVLLALVITFLPLSAFAAGTCQTPLAYSIGKIDPKFNITKYDLVQILQKAEAVWEEPTKRDLFTYVAIGGVGVNLVYDARQARTDSDKATLVKLSLIKAAFDGLHLKFSEASTSTIAEQTANDALFAAYKVDEAQYNADVAASNAKGGASGAEFAALNGREVALKLRFKELKAAQDVINEKIKKMNTLAGLLNLLSTGVNDYSSRYNASIAKVGEYEEG